MGDAGEIQDRRRKSMLEILTLLATPDGNPPFRQTMLGLLIPPS
jgi:hypothetical protein